MLLDCMNSSLEMLMDVNLVEEGIMRVLFAAIYLMFYKVSNDNEVSAALRYDTFNVYELLYLVFRTSS